MVKKQIDGSKLSLTRTARTVFFFAGFYALSIIIFDSGNLITRESVIQRWTLLSVLIAVTSVTWLIVATMSQLRLKVLLTIALTITLLGFAGFTSYWERGMASTSTLFYVLPLLVIATLKNRHALLATATLAATTYAFAAVKYFNDFFNEGFRIQLWGNIVLYGGTIFVCAWLIMILTDLRHDSK
jgi:hypothetical protein